MEKQSDYNLANLERISVCGFEMYITPRFQSHYQGNAYETLSTNLFSRFVKPGHVVVDIGAHYGYYSLLAAQNDATVFSFEPVQENFEILKKNISLNNLDTIQAHNIALSNIVGEKTFNVAEASDSSSFYDHPLTHTIEKRVVQTISLDSFSPGQNVDFVKIDTEGHELEVLDGMKDIIHSNPNIKLLIEFNPKCLRVAGKNPSDLLVWLSQKDFDIFFLDDKENLIYKLGDSIEIWEKIVDPMGYLNLFCVKKGSIPFISFISHSADMAGAERSLLDLVDGLKQRQVLCHVVLPVDGKLKEEFKKRVIPCTIASYRWWTIHGNEEEKKIEDEINAQAILLADVLDKVNPDIIYTNTSVINVGALTAKILGKPHVWHIREFGELDHNIRFTLPIAERSKFVQENSEYILYNSKAVEDYYGGNNTKSIVVYNNVSVPAYTVTESVFKSKESYKLGVLGTVHAGKNQEDVILAVSDLIREGLDIELVIVGYIEHNYGEKLKKLVFDIGLNENIQFLGNTPNPYPVLHQLDVLIISSKNEAFGRVIVEGMLEKKPVVATKSGGVVEIIKDGFNGLLYTPGDHKELAEKLKFLFLNKDKALEYGQNGYLFVKEHFNDSKYSGKITEIFDLMNGFVVSGLNSLYKKLWKAKEDVVQQTSIQISNLLKVIESELQEKKGIAEIVNQKNQEILDTHSKLEGLVSRIDFLEGEKNMLREQIQRQEEVFFREYQSVQSELVKQLGILDQKTVLLREKEEENRELIREYNEKIFAKDAVIQSKDQEIIRLSHEISQKTYEVALMSASKFWKLRTFYMGCKWAVRHPLKFLKKHLWGGIPTYSQMVWALSHPVLFVRKYRKVFQRVYAQKTYLLSETVRHIRYEGVSKTIVRVKNYLKHGKGTLHVSDATSTITDPYDTNYYRWIEGVERPFHQNLLLEKDTLLASFASLPIISVLIPTYNSDEIFFRKAVFSIINQWYPYWELCIVDDCSGNRSVSMVLDELQKRNDPRIKIERRKQNGGISVATNQAAALASGEFLAFLDHDDMVEPYALLLFVAELQKNQQIDVAYSDSDKIDVNGFRYHPEFKPDWSPELLLSLSYISHFRIIRKKLFDQVGGLRKNFDGSQDYDLALRVTEYARSVLHIPWVLYHWRAVPGSIALSSDAKPRARAAGLEALQEALIRRNIPGKATYHSCAYHNDGIYRIAFDQNLIQEKITIIIPTKDSVSVLRACIESIRKLTRYTNYEILVVNNNSEKQETFDYFSSGGFRVIDVPTSSFNFSYINNRAVEHADSEYIVFLNNDTEIINPDWLLELVGVMKLRDSIGAVGGKLLCFNNVIQHAGVTIMLSETIIAAHIFAGLDRNYAGYSNYAKILRNYAAVTAACMMVKKSVFQRVGGFNEKNLPIAYNDTDLCLRMREQGYDSVYNPEVLLYHHESFSREPGESPEEVRYMRERWNPIYLEYDPYVSKHFERRVPDYVLKEK